MFGKKALADLKALVFLYAVSQCEGKRRAAKEMGISVDTITKYIRYLEQECGTDLLHSSGGETKLTPRGAQFAAFAAELEQALKRLYILATEKDGLKGEVRLLWDGNIRADVVATDLWKVFRKNRNIRVTSLSFDSDNEVKNSAYDIALGYKLPRGDDWELFFSRPVKANFFASSEYLNKYGYPKDLEDMLQNHHMIFKSNSEDWLNEAKYIFKAAQHKVYVSDNVFMLHEAIKNGIGIGVMPSSFAKTGLVCLDNIHCEISANVYAVVHRDFKTFSRVKIVGEYLKEALNNL